MLHNSNGAFTFYTILCNQQFLCVIGSSLSWSNNFNSLGVSSFQTTIWPAIMSYLILADKPTSRTFLELFECQYRGLDISVYNYELGLM